MFHFLCQKWVEFIWRWFLLRILDYEITIIHFEIFEDLINNIKFIFNQWSKLYFNFECSHWNSNFEWALINTEQASNLEAHWRPPLKETVIKKKPVHQKPGVKCAQYQIFKVLLYNCNCRLIIFRDFLILLPFFKN